MIDFEVKLRRYDWKVIVVFITDKESLEEIIYELKTEDFDNETITALHNIITGRKDTGFVCSDYRRHLSYIIINNATTIAEFLDTFNHEKNHLEMHICKALDIDPFSEEAAILSGNVAKSIYLGAVYCCERN